MGGVGAAASGLSSAQTQTSMDVKVLKQAHSNKKLKLLIN